MSVEKTPKPTFATARDGILDHLQEKGWTVSRQLKVPHATNPDGDVRLWFKPQSVYCTKVAGTPHRLNAAHSLHIDIRDVTPEVFLRYALQFAERSVS